MTLLLLLDYVEVSADEEYFSIVQVNMVDNEDSVSVMQQASATPTNKFDFTTVER
jgi:hypothetical protein